MSYPGTSSQQQQQQQQQSKGQPKQTRHGAASGSSKSANSRKQHWRQRPNANRARRLEIGQETVRIIEEHGGVYPAPGGAPGDTVTISARLLSRADGPNAVTSYANATRIHTEDHCVDANIAPVSPVVTVADTDCLAEGLRLQDEGFNPLVLIMSSRTNPGGGFRTGAGAQEENLFRRSNLFQYLEPRKRSLYPVSDRGGIYVKQAVVFRDTEARGYAFLPTPRIMSFVAVPALRRPKLVEDTTRGQLRLTDEDRACTRDKVRAILNIGLAHGHDAIVLSALGCGAYGNPPDDVADAFYDVITQEYSLFDDTEEDAEDSTLYESSNAESSENKDSNTVEYDKRSAKKRPRLGYRHITFAIFDDKNSFGKHNTHGNLLPFQRRFGANPSKSQDMLDERQL
ncbi:hypothetical protein THASP1DRAFT_27643 [Thamnocephalis sphaerospora]|uniref:Microbial-type PARG catalytic domain-containing protein n=1 Tax=Thamnocephalis sphaerospora TaxID=78915 RepID=A0A4P9XWA0_9FUNG|nr:hypothetical protein THASP1DRAFT_27643 [Thamnocephalis sphaerospora]|eukprot:RKP10587.1 hypothetical protein THASP1DRAFT_27643 [Thamnocephalis sphaerospora]